MIIFGIIGLLLMTIGVLIHKKIKADELFIIGGFFLLVYSFFIKDNVFIILQIVFIIATIYDLIRIKRKKNKLKN